MVHAGAWVETVQNRGQGIIVHPAVHEARPQTPGDCYAMTLIRVHLEAIADGR